MLRFARALPSLRWIVAALSFATAQAGAPSPSLSVAPSAATVREAEKFFARPAVSGARVSPDGKTIALLALQDGHTRLFKLEPVTGAIDGLFSAGDGEVIDAAWISPRRLLISALGSEGMKGFVQDLGRPPRPVSGLNGTNLRTLHVLDEDHVVIADPSSNRGDTVRLDLAADRKHHLEAVNDTSAVLSRNGELRARWTFGAGEWHIAWRPAATAKWQELRGKNSAPPFLPLALTTDQRGLYVAAADQGDCTVLMVLDLATGQRQPIAQRAGRDLIGVQGIGDRPVGALFTGFGPAERAFLDPEAERLQLSLDQSLPDTVNTVADASRDQSVLVIRSSAAGHPPVWCVLLRSPGRIIELGPELPEVSPATFSKSQLLQFTTRDGLDEPASLLLPPTPSGPLPLIVMVPDAVGNSVAVPGSYLPGEHFLAQHGFAIAHVATRGTRGFGRRLREAGDFQLGKKFVEDVEDFVAHAAKQGLIDPKRVALYGSNLGALVALRAASIGGPFSAVVAVDASTRVYDVDPRFLCSDNVSINAFYDRAGGTRAAGELLRDFDPTTYASQLKVPVLLVSQGRRSEGIGAFEPSLRSALESCTNCEWFVVDVSDVKPAANPLAVRLAKIAEFLKATP